MAPVVAPARLLFLSGFFSRVGYLVRRDILSLIRFPVPGRFIYCGIVLRRGFGSLCRV